MEKNPTMGELNMWDLRSKDPTPQFVQVKVVICWCLISSVHLLTLFLLLLLLNSFVRLCRNQSMADLSWDPNLVQQPHRGLGSMVSGGSEDLWRGLSCTATICNSSPSTTLSSARLTWYTIFIYVILNWVILSVKDLVSINW